MLIRRLAISSGLSSFLGRTFGRKSRQPSDFYELELSRLAYEEKYYRWLLRHVLAHEIAHDVLEHQSGKHEASLNFYTSS